MAERFIFDFTVDPSGSFHYRWLFLVTVALLHNMIIIVGRSVFWEMQNSSPITWYFFDYVCDAIYVVDMFMHTRTGYLDQGVLVRNIPRLQRRYFMSRTFKLDLLSLLPTDLIYIFLGNQCNYVVPCTVIVRLNRLLRFYRMTEFFESTEIRTNHPFGLRIIKLFFFILVIIHWNSCVYFAISYAIGFGSDGWVYRDVHVPLYESFSYQYIYCFYWSTHILTTVGEVPDPEVEAEFVFTVFDFLIGVLIFATIVGNVGSIISNINAVKSDFQKRMDNIKRYMKFRSIGKELEEKVIQWFNYLWINKQALHQQSLTSILSEKLQTEIAIQVHLDTLKRVDLFHDCEPGLLAELVRKLKLKVFSPNDYVCCKGDVGKEMYIVKRGILEVVSDDDDTVYATLREGGVFGEYSILNICDLKTGNRRTASVRSVGFSDLFCMSKDDLWSVLEDYPEAEQMLVKRGRQAMIKDGYLDETREREEERPLIRKDKIDSLEEILEDLQDRFDLLLTEYTESQKQLYMRLRKLEGVCVHGR